MQIKINTDGGSRGNPGPAASAFVVRSGDETVFSEGKYVGVTTNNVAEYTAVLMAWEWVSANEISQVNFFLDSELVTKQLKGEYKIKDEKMKALAGKIKNFEKNFSGIVTYTYVPRIQNKEADLLVNQTLDSQK